MPKDVNCFKTSVLKQMFFKHVYLKQQNKTGFLKIYFLQILACLLSV